MCIKKTACTQTKSESHRLVTPGATRIPPETILGARTHHYPIAICPVQKTYAPGHVLGTSDANDSDLIPVTEGLVSGGTDSGKHQTPAKLSSQDREMTKGQ